MTLGNAQDLVDGYAAVVFLNCSGAIDCTHIPILPPAHLSTEYINKKGSFSMVMQSFMDHWGFLTNINVGLLEKKHDPYIFKNIGLFRNYKQGLSFLTGRLPLVMLKYQ